MLQDNERKISDIEVTTVNCVFENDLLLENIVRWLPMKDLLNIERVSKKWKHIANKLQKKRKALAWSFSKGDDLNKLPSYLSKLSSLPQHVLVFCNSALQDRGIKLEINHNSGFSGRQPPRKSRSKSVKPCDYLKQCLPSTCQVYGTCTDGVVGTTWEDSVSEHEGKRVLTAIMLPKLPRIDIYGFYRDAALHDINSSSDIEDDEDDDNEDDGVYPNDEQYIKDGKVNTTLLHQTTGVPDDKNVRLLLFFGLTHSHSDKQLMKAVIQHYGNVVIAGGIVDSFFSENLSTLGDSENEREHALHCIAICGSEEDVQVASVVIPSSTRSSEDLNKLFKKLKDTNISDDKAIAFMFACIGRGKQFHNGSDNVESRLFKRHFPTIPLFGFFGNGEIGYDYLPNYASPNRDKEYRPKVSSLYHAYTSIFVILSFIK